MDEIKVVDNSKDLIHEVLGISDQMDRDVCVHLARCLFLASIKGESKTDAITKFLKSEEFKKIGYPIDTANGLFCLGMFFVMSMRLIDKLEEQIKEVVQKTNIKSPDDLMDALLKKSLGDKATAEAEAPKPEEPKKGVDFIKFVEDQFGPISGEKTLERQKTVN